MPLNPFDEVLVPDILNIGRDKYNTTLELIRLFVNGLETGISTLTPADIGDLIVAGKINPTYLEAFLTAVNAGDVTFTSTDGGFVQTDVAAALDYLYSTLASPSVSAENVSVADTGGNFTGGNVEIVLAELYSAIGGASGGSPYIADDGRTAGFTLPGVDALSTASIAIGSNAQITESNNSIALGTNNIVYQGEDTYLMGRSVVVGANAYGNTVFGMFSTVEDTDSSFFWGHSSYLGSSLAQTSYSNILMGDGADGNTTFNGIILGSNSRVYSSAGIDDGIAIGNGAWVTIAFGGVAGESDGSTAIGSNAFIESSANAVLIGSGGSTDAISDDSVGLGTGVVITNSQDSISIGVTSNVQNSIGGVAIGWGAAVDTTSDSSVAIAPGFGLIRSSTNAVGIGRVADVQGSNSGVAIGSYTHVVSSPNGVVLGTLSEVQSSESGVAIGNNATVTTSNYGIAIGASESVLNSNYSVIVSADWGYSSVVGTVGNPNTSILNSIFGGDSATITTSNYSSIIGAAVGDITDSYLGLILASESAEITNANAYGAIISGVSNTISNVGNNNAIFAGSSNTISNDSDHGFIFGGSYNEISGDAWFRAILGGESNVIDRASVEYVAISPASNNTYARRRNEFVISGNNSNAGDLNRTLTPTSVRTGGKASTMQMLVRTTDATPTYLRLDNIEHIPLLDRTVTGFRVQLMASNFDETADESAYWELTFATDVREGIGRLLSPAVINEIHKDVPAWDVTVDVETISPVPADPLADFARVRIQVTGEAATNITWSARVDISEIDF